MQNNFFRKLIFDEKSRNLLVQALVIGFFAFFIYLIAQQTSYNLEKRGISTGFDFLGMNAGYDISISLIPFTSDDTHLRAYFVGLLNTLMIAVCGCFLATILGFIVGIIRLSSNWLFRNIAYVYVEFTRNVPVLLQIILYYSILLHLPKIKQAIPWLSCISYWAFAVNPTWLNCYSFAASYAGIAPSGAGAYPDRLKAYQNLLNIMNVNPNYYVTSNTNTCLSPTIKSTCVDCSGGGGGGGGGSINYCAPAWGDKNTCSYPTCQTADDCKAIGSSSVCYPPATPCPT